jgi:hypothetical protein
MHMASFDEDASHDAVKVMVAHGVSTLLASFDGSLFT